MDDGESGLFDCPHCGEEFQWGEIDEEIDHKKPTGSDSAMSRVPQYFGIVFVVGAVLLFFPVLIALLLPVLFGIFVISMFALTPIYIERRQQRLISTARSIQRNIKEIKEYELD